MKREDLRILNCDTDCDHSFPLTPEEFAEVASAEGYVKLDVDVEALRYEWEYRKPMPFQSLAMLDLARQVLAALDGETT